MTSSAASGRSGFAGYGLNRQVGYVFGVVYLLVGLLGFFVKSNGFAATDGGKLLGIFMVNPLHNIVHLAVGALLVYGASRGEAMSRNVNILVGGIYLVVGIIGLFILSSSANILALNSADNGLHFVSAVLLLGVGLAGSRGPVRPGIRPDGRGGGLPRPSGQMRVRTVPRLPAKPTPSSSTALTKCSPLSAEFSARMSVSYTHLTLPT